ncbi:MAG: hypothetical protein RSC43_00460 [Clostridia bacterium]
MSKSKGDSTLIVEYKHSGYTFRTQYVGDSQAKGKTFIEIPKLNIRFEVRGRVYSVRIERDVKVSRFYIGCVYAGIQLVYAYDIQDGNLVMDPMFGQIMELLRSNGNPSYGFLLTSDAVGAFSPSCGGILTSIKYDATQGAPAYVIRAGLVEFTLTEQHETKPVYTPPVFTPYTPAPIQVEGSNHTSRFVVARKDPLWFDVACAKLRSSGQIDCPMSTYECKGQQFIAVGGVTLAPLLKDEAGKDVVDSVTIPGIVIDWWQCKKLRYYMYVGSDSSIGFAADSMPLLQLLGTQRYSELFGFSTYGNELHIVYRPLNVHFRLGEIAVAGDTVYIADYDSSLLFKVREDSIALCVMGQVTYSTE